MAGDLFNKQVKLIELDAILDTRLTIYKEMGVDVDNIFQQGYRNRVYDRFPEVDYEAYTERYKNRDNGLLIAATVTELLYNIASEGMDNYDVRNAMGLTELNEVWINTYPYDLNEAQTFQIGKAVSTILNGSGYSVKMVHFKHEELSLAWMKENYVRQYYVYQYEEWLNANPDSIMKNKTLYDISIIAPWLITSELTDELSEYLDEMISSDASPPKILKGHFALWFSLDLTKSRLFSSIIADDIYPDYVVTD